MSQDEQVDLLVVGGGINGVGVARDAAGRGLKVLLCEMKDLAAATSSKSSKLVHGGLRYLEQYEFRLVRESLTEREVLWRAAPHLITPMRFVLPVHAGLRPPWMLRLGLFLYDHIGGRKLLPPARTVRRGKDHGLDPLKDAYRLGFEYSDCWADDARLVVANALGAAEKGAEILVGWALTAARRADGLWIIDLESDGGEKRRVRARALVNAAGPWVEQVLGRTGVKEERNSLRLVKGSHIVVPRLYEGDQAFTFQNADGRIAFAIPYEGRFTLIGTTDIPYEADPWAVEAGEDEVAYLCATASEYFRTPVTPADVVWTYSGVRPLHDDGEANASTVTRDYVFDLDAPQGEAPLLSIFGGKLTTFRKLAEHAMRELKSKLGFEAGDWTAHEPLPGGDFATDGFEALVAATGRVRPWAPRPLLERLCRAYGTRVERVLAEAVDLAGLGREVAPGVFEAELAYLKAHEWARTGEDVLWRRSKLGLHMTAAEREAVTAWMG